MDASDASTADRRPRRRLLLVPRSGVRRASTACRSVESGYAGGHAPNPTYEAVCGGRTGHAEVVRITFDPAVLSFRDLLTRVLHHPRPDDAEPPGQRRRHAVPLGDLLRRRREQRATPKRVIAELDARRSCGAIRSSPRSPTRRRSIRPRPTTRTTSRATAASRTARPSSRRRSRSSASSSPSG